MPRNGSGTYTLPAGNPVVSGSVASSSDFNSTMNDLAAALTNSLSKDGQTVVAGNLPMGGYKHTDVDDATARNQYASAGQVQDGSLLVLGGVSGTDAIVASATPAVTALTTGQTFRFRSAGENGGPVTLAVNGLSAVSVLKYGTEALVTADIASQGVCEVFYDGTHFQLLNPAVSPNVPATSSVETGTIVPYGGNTAPSGYLVCNGANVSRSTYAALFAAIGTIWGVGDGSTTFGLPDLRRRTLVGLGGTSTGTLGNTVGSTGGAETHTLTIAQMPTHSHDYTAQNNFGGTSRVFANDNITSIDRSTTDTGGGGAHNNMQPSAVVRYIIKT